MQVVKKGQSIFTSYVNTEDYLEVLNSYFVDDEIIDSFFDTYKDRLDYCAECAGLEDVISLSMCLRIIEELIEKKQVSKRLLREMRKVVKVSFDEA